MRKLIALTLTSLLAAGALAAPVAVADADDDAEGRDRHGRGHRAAGLPEGCLRTFAQERDDRLHDNGTLETRRSVLHALDCPGDDRDRERGHERVHWDEDPEDACERDRAVTVEEERLANGTVRREVSREIDVDCPGEEDDVERSGSKVTWREPRSHDGKYRGIEKALRRLPPDLAERIRALIEEHRAADA